MNDAKDSLQSLVADFPWFSVFASWCVDYSSGNWKNNSWRQFSGGRFSGGGGVLPRGYFPWRNSLDKLGNTENYKTLFKSR